MFGVLPIGKPVPTFPEALSSTRASDRKTGSHFSGSTLIYPCFRSENRFPLFRKHSIGRQAHRARSTTTRDQVTWCIGGGLKVSYAPYACQLVGRIFLPLRNEYAALLPWRHRRYGNVRRRRRTADSYENLTDNFCKRTPITGLRRHSTPHRLRSRQTHGHNSTRHN